MKFVTRKQVELAAFSQKQLLFDFLNEDKPELILELSFDKYKVSFKQNINDFQPRRRIASMRNDNKVKFCLPPASCLNSQGEDSLEELDLNPEEELRASRELQDLRKPRKVFDFIQQIR